MLAAETKNQTKEKKAAPVSAKFKDTVRKSPLIHIIRPTRDMFWKAQEFVLDRLAVIQKGISFRLLTTAIPKSGTHLITEMLHNVREIKRKPLCLSPRVPMLDSRAALEKLASNRYVYGHIGVNDQTAGLVKELNMSVLVMLRDPRDVVLSHIDHAYRLKPHILKAYYSSLANDRERLKAAIQGVPKDGYDWDPHAAEGGCYQMLTGYTDIGMVCRSFLAWKKVPGLRAHVVHFRDLIGERGGGTAETQFKTIKGVFEFLKLDYGDAEIEQICVKTYNPKSVTFNKGKQNRWKAAFDDELKDLFKKFAARELIEMGYEKDDKW